MAALSEQSASGASASAHAQLARSACSSASRSTPLAATPPTTASVSRPVDLERLASCAPTSERTIAALVGRGQVGAAASSASAATAVRSAVLRPLNERSRPGRPAIATGKRCASASPLARQPLERRAARVAEAEQPGALVERLAGGVVERLRRSRACRARGRPPRPAACGRPTPAAPGTAAPADPGSRYSDGDVAVQVVDRDQRQAAREGQRLGGRQADQQRADQARAPR